MRAGFLCLFGRTIHRKIGTRTVECIAAGTRAEPFKVKGKSGGALVYLEDTAEDKPRLRTQRALLALLEGEGGLEIARPQPPAGYRWKADLPGKFRIEFLADPDNPDGVLFRAHARAVRAFDASPWLEPIPFAPVVPAEEVEARWIRQALLAPPAPGEPVEDPWVLQQNLRNTAQALRGRGGCVPDWMPLAENSPIPAKVWQRVLTRLHHVFENCVEIGPVDRNGDGQHAAIDPLFEGTFWRLFNLLAFLYPESVQPQGSLRFAIHRETPQYVHLLESVERLAFREEGRSGAGARGHGPEDLPRITTVLWDHQRATAERMIKGFLHEKRRGFGDASCVGAGKTLSALAVMCGLAAATREKGDAVEGGQEGFLVLVRDIPLIETWRAEIEKHCAGFEVVTQNASGVLSGPPGRHSILVTTLARMRETPVHRRWQLVVIDECLAVQNAEALQTQEAWRQVLCARYGVLLLSATFFRSRFEKLFYLLKMLRSDLPETREYLDALLSESIVCNLPKDEGWRWTTHVNRIPLEAGVRAGYDAILGEPGRDAKTLYQALQKHLRGAVDPVGTFRKVIETRMLPGDRALIFTASKEEADALVAAFPREVSRFRAVAGREEGRHIAASVAEAAHGVNHLVCCNVIVMRPPSPDLLPQMKGRLARPGQKQTELRIEYLLLEDTIEEADLIRLEEAARFHSHYLMPLAEFYELAVRGRRVGS
jgi:superfamily II DNA or RNA helicase